MPERGAARGSSGSAASMQAPATSQAAGHELAATTWGMTSGVTNSPRYTLVLAMPSAVPAREAPACVASSV
ncbi:hypothetical protein D3C86_2042780 [compost metagenome]